MNQIQNETFSLEFNHKGIMDKLLLKKDSFGMNWIINEDYLNNHGYEDRDKLFGQFILNTNKCTYTSDVEPIIKVMNQKKIEIMYKLNDLSLVYIFDLSNDDEIQWSIKLTNHNIDEHVYIDSFHIWASVAYIMFRDKDIFKNINESCAVFPYLSNDFSKIACVRRNNIGPHLGIYNFEGPLLSIGSFCRYQNLFLEQVSPSLDGCIFHSLELITSNNRAHIANHDWIYSQGNEQNKIIAPNETRAWEFIFKPFSTKEDFYDKGLSLEHPVINFTSVITKNSNFVCDIQIPSERKLERVWFEEYVENDVSPIEIMVEQERDGKINVSHLFQTPGEKKLLVQLDNGAIDFVVFTVLEPINEIIEERIRYLCGNSFISDDDDINYAAFKPVSNQGESLGKLSLILMKNLVGTKVPDEIKKVEKSALYYVKNKWFIDGDFTTPRKLYGDFYRIFDFDYIAHVFYLLSKFKDEDLLYHSSETYLKWATQVMILRFDESMHKDEREKNETKLCGVFSLFIKDLLMDTKARGIKNVERLHELCYTFGERLKKKSDTLSGAITEHYYDNAGFGPSCETLAVLGYKEEAAKYGELLLANIGFSNDYRAQNPDRWWEALAYMVHSLWGGLVANSTLVAYEHLGDPSYLNAAYRSTMPVFLCYDWNVQSTNKRLQKGEAASTYCVANPNYNFEELSRNRFGQSIFVNNKDGLFQSLFQNALGDDWDMGEELAAYLRGFGTKTFLYYENGKLACINGDIEKVDDYYIIKSFAAYPKEYHFKDRNVSFIAQEGILIPSIAFNGEMFYELDTSKIQQ